MVSVYELVSFMSNLLEFILTTHTIN
uniref:Uncharacterized protein n=1 Tax=Rhizophora mucronata TaxID=61149 RepID=A0A2P2JWY0_RHIMU